MTAADRIVSGAVLALAVAPALAFRPPEGPARAVVSVGTEEVATLRLDRPGTFPFAGRRGTVVVQVEDGAVRIVESDCPQHLCVAMGAKSRPGEIIACVPNALVIRLQGVHSHRGEEPPDAIAR
jgi:hypothetical protein